MNKKILILVNHDVAIYNFRKELVTELLSDGYDVYISSPYGERIDRLVELGCKFIPTDINRHGVNPLEDLKLKRTYKKMIKDIKPMCVLTYTIKPNIYGARAAKECNVPCLANITGLGTAVERRSVLQSITVNLYKYAFKNIHTVFFQNKENRQFFIDRKIAVGTHQLLPGSGVNLEDFNYLSYPNDDVINFVFISRIMKEKGIDLYLDTAKLMKEKYDNVEFHICGFCEEDYEDLLAELEKEGIIKYHGMVSDIKAIHKDAHCLVHPTYYPEGLSNVLLEASSSGRPIITTDRSGCREVINKGKNGYVIKQNHLDSLINAVDEFINLDNESKKNMGLEGRHFVSKEFDRKIVVDKYRDTIKKVESEQREK